MRAIHWFRSDLRLADNSALAAACRKAKALVLVFVLDDLVWREFYRTIIDAYPRVLDGAFRKSYDALEASRAPIRPRSSIMRANVWSHSRGSVPCAVAAVGGSR